MYSISDLMKFILKLNSVQFHKQKWYFLFINQIKIKADANQKFTSMNSFCSRSTEFKSNNL